LRLLQPLLDEVNYFEETEFTVLDCDFVGDSKARWGVTGDLFGVAMLKSGGRREIHVDLALELVRKESDPIDAEASWSIASICVTGTRRIDGAARLFREDFGRAVRDPSLAREAQRDLGEEQICEKLSSPDFHPTSSWLFSAAMQNETVVVVDVDRD